MNQHEQKVCPHIFAQIENGEVKALLEKGEQKMHKGDTIMIREVNSQTGRVTGNVLYRKVLDQLEIEGHPLPPDMRVWVIREVEP